MFAVQQKKHWSLYQQFPPRLFTMRTRAERIFYTPMVTYTKQPISIVDQMAMLKNRGLLFDDEKAAVECQKIISYFRLANIGNLWKAVRWTIFKPKSKFENVVTLYNFDKELCTLIFSGQYSMLARYSRYSEKLLDNRGAETPRFGWCRPTARCSSCPSVRL